MMHSFLLIGQSNMAGRGFLDEAREIDTSRLYTLRNGRWVKLFRPIHSDRVTAGVSLAESFAEAYAKKYNVDVGLICCADGGTSLNQWQQGELLYDNAVSQAKLAQRTSTIVGVLWHQGEADCSPSSAATYKPRFERMIHALYRDLGLSGTPLLLGELGEFLAHCTLGEHFGNYPLVNEQLHAIAKENEGVGIVSAKGLTSNEDFLHFNAESLYEFGLRYFEVLEALPASNRSFEEKADGMTKTELERL
jgi:hypothetical protein